MITIPEVLQELVGDKSLEHFRLEYEKLHRALKKSVPSFGCVGVKVVPEISHFFMID